MRIRVLPSDVQVHTFELLGAMPMRMDLTEAIERIRAGTIDAQENPLANTVTYGVHKFHRFHTLTSHFYLSRPIFLHRPSYDAWPNDLKHALQAAVRQAVTVQRELAVQEESNATAAITRGLRGTGARSRRARVLRGCRTTASDRGAKALSGGVAVALAVTPSKARAQPDPGRPD
jgi:TRAP-type mannitol/chloroaromatic compound transport system substrate-binding protein